MKKILIGFLVLGACFATSSGSDFNKIPVATEQLVLLEQAVTPDAYVTPSGVSTSGMFKTSRGIMFQDESEGYEDVVMGDIVINPSLGAETVSDFTVDTKVTVNIGGSLYLLPVLAL